jgi:predicted nucleic acid-binding protein
VIVVDVNVLAYLLIEGPSTLSAQELLLVDPDWRVPDLWRHELLNVLATYVRTHKLALVQALAVLETAERNFGPRTVSVPANDALRAAERLGISGYDAQYIMLATILSVRCVTEDRPLRRAAPEIAISIADFIREHRME